MLQSTLTAVGAILATDPSLSVADRQKIVAGLKAGTAEPAPERLLTRREVATLFNRSRRCLAYWEAKGLLTPVKVAGRTIGYPAVAVRRLAEARATQ